MADQQMANPSELTDFPTRGEAEEHLNNGNKHRGNSWWKDATMELWAVSAAVGQTQMADLILVISSLITHPHLCICLQYIKSLGG